jgi:AmmeMemoRadiSam system protein A
MSSADALLRTLSPHAGGLIALARDSVRHGLDFGRPLDVAAMDLAPALQASAASFVTLHIDSTLRGCIGSIEARRPLAADVAHNAFAAAFHDTRFDPLHEREFDALDIEISVLGMPEPIAFAGEAELLRLLVVGRDGLIIEQNGRRAVFLPQVWEDLPDPADFVGQLKRKAGIGRAPLGRNATARRFNVVKLTLDAEATAG